MKHTKADKEALWSKLWKVWSSWKLPFQTKWKATRGLIREFRASPTDYWGTPASWVGEPIVRLFIWRGTPEGHGFWSNLADTADI